MAFPGAIPSLTDGVVTLRALRDDDTDAIVTYGSDAEITRWMTLPTPYSRADVQARQRRAEAGWASGEFYQFAVEAEGQLAGGVNLRPLGAGRAEVGYALGAEYRGRGLMSRALRLALRWGFQDCGIEVVHWQGQVGNWASRRVAWAVGFRMQDGVVPGLLEHQGRSVDGWLATLRQGDRLEPAHPWLVPERITGKAVVLRAHRDQDLPRMVEACRDPQTQYWLSDLPTDYTEVEGRQHLDQIRSEQASGKSVYWVAADPGDDRLLAELGLFLRISRDPQAEIGYWSHPEARGRSVTTEAVQLAVRHALLPVEDGGLGQARVQLRAAEGNIASQRVAEKAGFTLTGRDRDARLSRDGSRSDHLRFDLLPAELPARR